MSQFLGVVQSTGRGVSAALEAVDDNYIAADQFITGMVMALLAVAVFGLAIWVWHYSQAKSLMAGG